mgnify:CR=1 FL=1
MIEVVKSSNLTALELNVLERIHEDIKKCNNINSVNKLYRQGRTWNRWHSIGLKREFKTDETYKFLNEKFKEFRNEARERLVGTINK